MSNKKFRPSAPQSLVYVQPRMPAVRPGQRLMPIAARDKEDGDQARARISGYAWARLIASGPYRTGVSTWTFILSDDTRSNQAQKMAEIRAKRVSDGKCWECPNPAVPGRKRCQGCLERKRLRQKMGPPLP